jgi:hypothetical protein
MALPQNRVGGIKGRAPLHPLVREPSSPERRRGRLGLSAPAKRASATAQVHVDG